VVVLGHRQLVAALGAAPSQHFAAISGFHALAETMDADAAVNSRLVGPFGHSTSSQKRSFISLTALDYTATLLTGQRFSLLIFNL